MKLLIIQEKLAGGGLNGPGKYLYKGGLAGAVFPMNAWTFPPSKDTLTLSSARVPG